MHTPQTAQPTYVFLGVATALLYAAVGVVMPVLPRWTALNVSASGSTLGSLAIAYTVGAIGCRPLLAKIGPFMSQAHIAIIGGLTTAVGFSLHRFATSFEVLAGARLIVAVGETFAYLGISGLIASAAGPNAARAMSYNSAALFAGLGVGPLIGDALSRQQHWTLAFAIPTSLCLASALGVSLLGSRATEPPRAAPGASLLGIHRPSIRPGIVLGLLILAQTTWQTYLTPYADLKKIGGVGVRLAIFAFGVLVLRIMLAKVPEIFGIRRTAVVSVSMVSLSLVVLGVVGGSAGIWLATIGGVIGMAQMFPSLVGLVLESEPNPANRALALSTFTMFFEIGGAAAGISGFAIDRIGYESTFIVVGILSAVGIPLLVSKPRRPQIL